MSRQIWSEEKINELFERQFFELIHEAYMVHRANFDSGEMEFCTLSSIKTGACPEDCAYCPQSAHYNTNLKKEKLIDIESVLIQAKKAKECGAKRFCMGAAWKSPPKKDLPTVLEMIREVKKIGLETCVTLGMLDEDQATQLKSAGLDFYNHNLDTSPEFYSSIITTRTYQDRLDTIKNVINADINVCCGGILGMGETRADRIQMLLALDQLPVHPASIPMNKLIPIKGTPLENEKPLDSFEFIKTIAIARLIFPKSKIRLSAGREGMSDEIGDKLLTAKNPDQNHDMQLLQTLNIRTPSCITFSHD